MRPRALPTRISNWRKRSRRLSTGSPQKRAARSKGRPPATSVLLTSSMTAERRAERQGIAMHHAWIDGTPAELPTAAATAARLLDASRQPLIAGLGADVAGARAATALAQRIGAAIDHMNADALLRDLDILREAGLMLTTPSETIIRADTLLLVGPGASDASSELSRHLLGAAGERGDSRRMDKRIFWLCPGRHAEAAGKITIIGLEARDLPVLLATLRARVNGRPAGSSPVPAPVIDGLADALQAARFGVAVWL